MKRSLIFMATLFCISTAFAASCPETLEAKGEEFTAPPGWQVTLKKLAPSSSKLLFYIAIFNYDHTNKENGNRISCLYEDRENISSIELTSNEKDFPKPNNILWKPLDDTALYCFPETPLKAAECTW